MNIRDAMKLPSFASAEIVAGTDQLDRTVTSAMVLEAVDIESWAKRGQLLITSYFALQSLDETELEAFFQKIDDIGISGIIFKTDRLVRRIPLSMVELCERHDIPLLSVSKEVRYEELLMDIFGNLLESNLTLLNHFYDVHQQVMELASTQPTIYQILASLKHAISAEVTFFDRATPSKTSTANAPSDFASWKLARLESERYQSFTHYRAILEYEDGRRKIASVVEVPDRESDRYYLVVHADPNDLDRTDAITAESFANLLQIELLKQSALAHERFTQHNNTTLDLLLNRYPSHDEIDSALKNLEIDRFPLYQVALIAIRMAHSEDDHRKPDVLEAIRRSMRTRYAHFAYFVGNDRIVLLNNYEDESGQFKKGTVRSLLAALREDDSLPEFTHIAAISESSDRYSIGNVNKEVLDIYQIFGGSAPRNRCVSYSDLGCLRAFLNVEDFEELRSSIDPRILKLHDENVEQFATLVALCENNLHYQETAQQLFLHPKTVRYRVNQIEAVYDVDVHDPDDFLQILLAGRIMTLAENVG